MTKATDELLKDHRMVRKVLEDFRVENPRFPHLLKTLHRIVAAHAWFEDTIFLPALEAEPRLKRLDREISEEHKDIDYFLKALRKTEAADRKALDFNMIQLRAILETHFRKEEDALFPPGRTHPRLRRAAAAGRGNAPPPHGSPRARPRLKRRAQDPSGRFSCRFRH